MSQIDRLGDIHVERREHVAHVEIRKPPYNTMSVDLARDLADVLEALEQEPSIRAVALTTSGTVFCGGADLVSSGRGGGSNAEVANALYVQAVRLHMTALPIVAAIQGAAVGAGLGLALIADLRISSQNARFAANFTRLGFHPGFGLTHTLPRLIGEQRAALMFLTSRRVQADVALSWGLVDSIVPNEGLLQATLDLAIEIAENAPLAVRSTRKTLRSGLAAAVANATKRELAEQSWLMNTADFQEGVLSVSERRPATFLGR